MADVVRRALTRAGPGGHPVGAGDEFVPAAGRRGGGGGVGG
ncbi:hypothetical protein [Streptomyces noursei]